MAGVQNLDHIQRNTDAQLKNIIDGQLEIKSMFKFAQTELRAVKDSISDLYVKHNTTQNTARIIQEGIVSNTLAIQTNFEIAKEHNLLIEKRLDMLAKQEKEVSNPPKQSKPIVQPLATEDKGDFNKVLKHQSSSANSSTGAQLKSTMEPINEEKSVSNLSDQVDPIIIVSKPIAQTFETKETVSIISDSVPQVPKLKLKRS